MKQLLFFSWFLLASAYSVDAQKTSTQDTTKLLLDFPILDFPYQSLASQTYGNIFAGYGSPSMKQSLLTTSNFYSATHFGISQAFKKIDNKLLRGITTYASVTLFDILTLSAPLADGWLHEEYHRNVLTRHKARSKNQMNQYPIGIEAVYVYGIKDEDLQNLHDNYRPDWRRLQVAGKEGELHLLQNLQKNNFFYNQGLPHIPLYWLLTISTGEYVRTCAGDDFNTTIDEMNQKDGADILKRDFTGPDYTAWAYALFRPNALYSERGIHPSGVGVNRYIKPQDLTNEEREFIRKQGSLQWLNLLSPALFGFSKIKVFSNEEGNHYANFAVRSVLNPFGNDIMFDIFYQTPRFNLFVALHNYNNRHTYFPGLEAQIIDYPIWNSKLAVSPRLMLWTQPQDLDFDTTQKQVGGLLGVSVRGNTGRFCPYAEIEAKTKGWVMGNVFLNENVRFSAGLRYLLF